MTQNDLEELRDILIEDVSDLADSGCLETDLDRVLAESFSETIEMFSPANRLRVWEMVFEYINSDTALKEEGWTPAQITAIKRALLGSRVKGVMFKNIE